jgi:DNA repair protein SbcC/Rad50
MTPLSITLENFLCYGTSPDGGPYVYDFRGARLWSIAGDNGSGKSAIFDAITYCLFGEHRGGRAGDEELVHKGASAMRATFEFSHGDTEYRVTRQIRLGRRPRAGTATTVRECRMEWLRPDGEWVELPDTLNRSGLEAAVKRLLGFGFETFTASMLLVQGKGDRLVLAGGKDRFDILSGIFDLRHYERLEDRARVRSRTSRSEQQHLLRMLEEAPPATEQEVATAASLATDAETEAESAQALKEAASRTLDAVRKFHELTDQLAGLRAKQEKMAAAVDDATVIRSEAAERQQIVETLPRLRQAVKALADARGAADASEKARLEAAAVDVEGLGLSAREASKEYEQARGDLTALVDEIASTGTEVEAIAADVALARRLDDLDARITQAAGDAAKLMQGADATGELRGRMDRLQQVAMARDLVGDYVRARESEAEALEWAAGAEPEAVRLDRERERAAAEDDLARATGAAQVRKNEVVHAEAELRAAERTAEDRREAGDEGTCSHCGQKVDAAHIRRELELAASRIARCSSALSELEAEAAAAAKRAGLADEVVKLTRLAESEASAMAATAARARARIADIELDERFAALPADVRELLAASAPDLRPGVERLWSDQRDLPGLQKRLSASERASAQADAKRAEMAAWQNERGQLIEQLSQTRADETQARDVQLHSRLSDLRSREAEARKAEDRARRTSDAAAKALNVGESTRRAAEAKADLRSSEAHGHRQRAEAALTGVAERFQPVTADVVNTAETRLHELADADARLDELARAETGLARLRGQIATLQAQVDVTPAGDRVPEPDAVAAAKEAADTAAEARASATRLRKEADQLVRLQADRIALQRQADEAGTKRAVWDRLAQLLGRGGIQGFLMRAALADIQERANVLLSRISSANLQLDISFVETPRGEEISFRCVDAASSEDPLDVAFLSGGQRFRCAVALAAGIGEHAGLGGTMPSVIIDEGFGSLDTEGRTEMLEEIRAMSVHYERVIVVSHLESLHDRSLFPAGYELRKQGMQTLVTPTLWLARN